MPPAAQAHRAWLLPSATVLSGEDAWVTVDAAISNDLFYFEHQPMRLDGLQGHGARRRGGQSRERSTGRTAAPSTSSWRRRHLQDRGDGDTLFASYKLERPDQALARHAEASIAQGIPADAQDLQVTRRPEPHRGLRHGRQADRRVFKPTGAGLELVPVTHPNDLFVGRRGTFRFLLDGKPAAGIEVSVIPGGIRYRDQLGEMKLRDRR